MFFIKPLCMYFERTLITRVTTSLGKASKLEIGVDTKSHKKVAFHQLYSALGRPRRTLEALLTSPYFHSGIATIPVSITREARIKSKE